MKLRESSALVTGAASGLGAAMTASLAEAGATVIGVDLPDALDEVANTDAITYVGGDVTSADDVRHAVDLAADLGPFRVAVNCAGIAPSARILGRTGIHDLGMYAKVVSVNLVGTFTVLALAAERMSQNDPDDQGQRGVVVNTASIAAYDGQIGQAAYASSKGGIVGLTLPAARDLARHSIRVCTIAPGTMDTAMVASLSQEVRDALAADVPFPGRLGRPEEFAQLAMAIIDHDYLNGEVIRMDGALRMGSR